MNKNNERRFRIVDCGTSWYPYYKVYKGREITLDKAKGFLTRSQQSIFNGTLKELNAFNSKQAEGNWYVVFEEIFNEDDLDKEYTIDELEEGVEYQSTNADFTFRAKGGQFQSKHICSEDFSDSSLPYNSVKQMKFTKVQPPKKYTFDEAKADCENNGTEYVLFGYDEENKVVFIQNMSRNPFDLVVITKEVINSESKIPSNRIIMSDGWWKK